MSKFMKSFSDNNLKNYDTAINIILIVLSLMLLVPIIQFLMKKAEENEDFASKRRVQQRVAVRPAKRTKDANKGAIPGIVRGFGLTIPKR